MDHDPCRQREAYLAGELERAEAEAFRQHLALCAECQAELELDAFVLSDLERQSARLRPPAELVERIYRRGVRRDRRRRLAAVSLVALAALVLILRGNWPGVPFGGSRGVHRSTEISGSATPADRASRPETRIAAAGPEDPRAQEDSSGAPRVPNAEGGAAEGLESIVLDGELENGSGDDLPGEDTLEGLDAASGGVLAAGSGEGETPEVEITFAPGQNIIATSVPTSNPNVTIWMIYPGIKLTKSLTESSGSNNNTQTDRSSL